NSRKLKRETGAPSEVEKTSTHSKYDACSARPEQTKPTKGRRKRAQEAGMQADMPSRAQSRDGGQQTGHDRQTQGVCDRLGLFSRDGSKHSYESPGCSLTDKIEEHAGKADATEEIYSSEGHCSLSGRYRGPPRGRHQTGATQ